ncbi:hypothetical protein E8K88_14870 [Lampropedia aestuarii]|uniref:Uncharacterized protein n=1 Tax=Lampropedia aestuarii TaxID=2562762 RepID=A0A4S5BL62_9BURK|nr:hypothetical protein [Lampropedia aestuarii]THJ31441.1 hypothetical protein E8K88_14870 [Lampropedia aestuarii]
MQNYHDILTMSIRVINNAVNFVEDIFTLCSLFSTILFNQKWCAYDLAACNHAAFWCVGWLACVRSALCVWLGWGMDAATGPATGCWHAPQCPACARMHAGRGAGAARVLFS